MKPNFVHTMDKTSLWKSTTLMPEFPALTQDVATDVCIIGGGLAGLSTAYALCREGRSVVVLEGGELASGMTESTTAHLTCVNDELFVRLESLHGLDGARLAVQSHMAAIDRIEKIVRDEHIDCDFRRVNAYVYRSPDAPEDELSREFLAAQRAGAPVQFLEQTPLPFPAGPCLRFADQGQFHPLKYLSALALAIVREGGRIYTKTHATSIKAGPPASVETPRANVSCKDVVVATNTPVNDLILIHTKQSAFMTYVVGARVPHGTLDVGLFYDTAEPYHYFRTQELGEGSDILIIGGEDHRCGQEPDTLTRYTCLQKWARERFPQIESFEFEWCGEVMQSVDGLAYIGHNPMDKQNIYVVTGDSGMGMTHGTIASMLLTDLIQGRENPWATLYSPSRRTLRAAGTYAKDVVESALPYVDWLTGGDVDSIYEIKNNSGAVVRRGLKKIAVYRDETGTFHEMSAVCPHLGGIVRWNDSEKTWDCPCHGSRFSKCGEAIHGPANTGLSVIEPMQEPEPGKPGFGE